MGGQFKGATGRTATGSSTAAGLALSVALACSGDDQGSASAGTSESTGGSATTGESTSEATSAGSTTGATTAGGSASASAGTTTAATASTSAGTTTNASTTAATTGESTSDGSTTGVIEPDPRQVILESYAPRVWLPGDEAYFPSSVEHSFAHTTRFADGEGKFWIRSTDPLESPSDTLPFFAGDLDDAPVYAYYADKDAAGIAPGFVDLVYFFYYPYNRGKEVVDTIWGNHVGDWEHITVRLRRELDQSLTPVQIYLSAHSFGGVYEWAAIDKVADTHPVVYSAWGSHGVWDSPGDHVYMTIGEEVWGVCVTLVCADLTDVTAADIAWDTWEDVAGSDFFAEEGLGGYTWPTWMSDAFADPGPMPIDVPGQGPIFRWGNTEDCSTLGVDISDLIGVCRLEDGPTGPISKDVWGAELL